MRTHPLTRSLAVLLTITLIAPSAFFIAPHRAHAIFATTVELPGPLLEATVKTSWETTIDVIKDTLTSVHTFTSAVANEALVFNAYVLQPLAFVLSGNLLKLLTASVLDFVIGKINGTGAPQFVQDLNGNLQRIGDIRANAFFMQFNRNMNSPFSYAISSSLRTNYLWKTSNAGFFAENQCPYYSSANANSFLAGNWSKGGTSAWFSVTTQTACNPYTLYQASQSQLASVVGSAISARLAELDWGNGFLSWCGANDPSAPVSEEEFPVGGGINPGDACFDKDGNFGTIKTPGSTIKATLDKVLGSTQDKLNTMGQLASEVGQILGNVATVFSTVNFAAQLLGGPGSGGLFGVGQTSATNPTSRLMQYQNTPSLGVTSGQVYQNAAKLPASGQDMSNRITQYESSWNTVRSAANSASANLTGLANFCTTAASTATGNNPNFASSATAQAAAARSAITTQIAPVLAQADTAATVIANARAMVQKIQTELNSGSVGVGSSYAADIQALQTMPPTTLDVANAQQETQSFGMATAIPAGSLTVSGGSIVDRMALIATNAEALKTSACTENGNSGGAGSSDN